MARHRRQNQFRAGELNLTAMIDVAFQLLAFFILTVHPVDVLANLNAMRPMTTEGQGEIISAIRITVFPGGYTVNGATAPVPLDILAEKLGRLALIDKSQTILIQCTNDSDHGQLVSFLDTCAKLGLSNLSVVSSGGS